MVHLWNMIEPATDLAWQASVANIALRSFWVLLQVLPTDVDYRVMLTFLEFYHTLLQFVNYKLYHSLGVQYPPVVDPKLEEAAAGLESLMQVRLQSANGSLEAGKPTLHCQG